MKKLKGLLLFLLFYLIAYGVGYLVSLPLDNLILKGAIFTLVATAIIYGLSLIIANSSLYDPYWSLTPIVIFTYLLFNVEINVYTIVLYVAMSLWSHRLTINWILNFEDIKWEDWRYQNYRKNNSKLMFQIINFFGIMMTPTVLVYICMIPMIYSLEYGLNALSLISSGLILLGFVLEIIADSEMRIFKKTAQKGDICDIGLWKYSRHPNYLGENMIWLGSSVLVFLTDISKWYLGLMFILMVSLFLFISIPLMEKRQLERKEKYREYMKKTSMFLLLPNKK